MSWFMWLSIFWQPFLKYLMSFFSCVLSYVIIIYDDLFQKKPLFLKNSSSNRVKLFQWWCWCIIEHYFCRYQYHSSDPLGLPKWIIMACIKGVFELFYNKSILFIWYIYAITTRFFSDRVKPFQTKILWNHCNIICTTA